MSYPEFGKPGYAEEDTAGQHCFRSAVFYEKPQSRLFIFRSDNLNYSTGNALFPEKETGTGDLLPSLFASFT